MGHEGHIQGGRVVLDEPLPLPQGTAVSVSPLKTGGTDEPPPPPQAQSVGGSVLLVALCVGDALALMTGARLLASALAAPASLPPHDEVIGILVECMLGTPIAAVLAASSVAAAALVKSAPSGLRLIVAFAGVAVVALYLGALATGWSVK